MVTGQLISKPSSPAIERRATRACTMPMSNAPQAMNGQCRTGHVLMRRSFQDCARIRSSQQETAHRVGKVGDGDALRRVALEPAHVEFSEIVGAHQPIVAATPVEDGEVALQPPVWPEHRRQPRLPRLRQPAGEQPVEPCLRRRARTRHSANRPRYRRGRRRGAPAAPPRRRCRRRWSAAASCSRQTPSARNRREFPTPTTPSIRSLPRSCRHRRRGVSAAGRPAAAHWERS